MSTDVECVVIGAGVVGLAVARRLAQSGRETLILESADLIGSGISSRNSEVIHAGIYYPRNSLKALLCARGREMLYDFCRSRNVAHHRCGKIIVAENQKQLSEVAGIAVRARANGVDNILELTSEEISNLEPEVTAVGGLLSPSTGIVDSHAIMLALLGEAEYRGARLVLSTTVTGISKANGELSVNTIEDGEVFGIKCKHVVNAAGLGSVALVPSYAGESPVRVLAKGSYFRLVGPSPFSRLIYPVPEPGGLGIHATIDLQGYARFGPDVEWVDEELYNVDEKSMVRFHSRISRYWPGIADRELCSDYAGIRPKIAFGQEVYSDFLIQGSKDHGYPGLVNLLGIESPGLTSSLAIADLVGTLIQDVPA